MTGPPERALDGADAPASLVLTGERTLPGIPDERYWFERHVVAYRLAQGRVRAGAEVAPRSGRGTVAPSSGRGTVVLDAGCGEGYGLAMLAEAGHRAWRPRRTRVIGVDLDPAAVAHARATYGHHGSDGRPDVEVHHAELMSLPLDDDEVDLTVSFQVIEHLYDIPGYLRSLGRVTRPGGEVWIATPNRLTFTPGSDTPVNPFHTREFTAAELVEECRRADLDVTRVVGIGHGRRLRAVERLTGHAVPDHLAASPPDRWPRWLRTLVHRVDASWFTVSPGTVDDDGTSDLDEALDLLAVCRVPRT